MINYVICGVIYYVIYAAICDVPRHEVCTLHSGIFCDINYICALLVLIRLQTL